MINCPKEWLIAEEYKDIATVNAWKVIEEVAREQNDEEVLREGAEGQLFFSSAMCWSLSL